MAQLLYFPINREIAERLGPRGFIAHHPFADGEPQGKRSGGLSLMEEARAENERLKARIVTARPQLTAEMVNEGKHQSAARLKPCFHIGGVEFGDPFPKLRLLKKISSLFRHWFAPRASFVTGRMRAQPDLRHGKRTPAFPEARSDDFVPETRGGGDAA